MKVGVSMYRVIKPLNNSVAIVRTESGEQAVVMGSGIAFQKKKGDLISPDHIEKVFTLKNKESKHNFSTLLKDIPLDFITTTYEIIENAIDHYHYPVQEYIYVTLTDHIHLVYQHILKGQYELSRLPDMRKDYPVEFRIAEDALEMINQRLGITLPDDEIGRIALHFINAKGSTVGRDDNNLFAKNIIILVQNELRNYGITRNEANQNYYDRLMVHLNYFLERISDQNEDKNQFSTDFEQTLKKDYPKAYEIGDNIYHLISKQIDRELSESERVYFTIHIQRLL